ncbi:MAG TPA: hypothetical protein VLS51_11765 [Propionibacteriaceae bacterium]|nr:hypothetical protein [Propionibacteriaceae bacterium]
MSTDSVGPQPTSDDLQAEATDPALYPTGDPEPDEQSTESRDVDEPDAAAVEAGRVRMDEVKTEAVINHYRI